jgi:hypothetical protein
MRFGKRRVARAGKRAGSPRAQHDLARAIIRKALETSFIFSHVDRLFSAMAETTRDHTRFIRD